MPAALGRSGKPLRGLLSAGGAAAALAELAEEMRPEAESRLNLGVTHEREQPAQSAPWRGLALETAHRPLESGKDIGKQAGLLDLIGKRDQTVGKTRTGDAVDEDEGVARRLGKA